MLCKDFFKTISNVCQIWKISYILANVIQIFSVLFQILRGGGMTLTPVTLKTPMGVGYAILYSMLVLRIRHSLAGRATMVPDICISCHCVTGDHVNVAPTIIPSD